MKLKLRFAKSAIKHLGIRLRMAVTVKEEPLAKTDAAAHMGTSADLPSRHENNALHAAAEK